MALNWRGDEVEKKLLAATRVGINRTMGDAVLEAKSNHPYIYRSGAAERSVRIVTPAKNYGSSIAGFWGSVNVHYFKYLEFGFRGRFASLVPAARRLYPRLAGYIREAFSR